MRALCPAVAPMLLLLASSCAREDASAEQARAPARPAPGLNLLWISLDSVRRDALSCYGGGSPRAPGVATSPQLDALAGAGVRLENAYASSSWTLPTHLSLFTGTQELVHGVDQDQDRLPPDSRLLTETLQAAGWRTAGFFSGPYLEAAFGFGRGFERYERCYGPELARASQADFGDAQGSAYDPRQPASTTQQLSHRDVSSKRVTDAALAELEAQHAAGRPWFLFLHYFDPHYDYIPPAPYDQLLDPDYSGPVSGKDFFTDPAISTPDPREPSGRIRHASKRDLDHVRALYLGELAWVDAQIGRVLERLDELGLAARTLVVVSADHGDEFFENGGIGHRRTLAEEVVRVPLLLRLPGVLRAGSVPSLLVSHADLAPTLLDLLQVEGPRGTGKSFAAALSGGDDSEPRSVLARLVTTARARGEISGVRYEARLVTVRETFHSGSLKLLRLRSWPEPVTELAAELRAAFATEQSAAYAKEYLAWVDLALHPLDHDADYSEDFGDPRARAALARFRAEYARLSVLRTADQARTEPLFQDELAALGYASGDGPAQRELLALPLPGAAR